jgi:hypothetical protein
MRTLLLTIPFWAALAAALPLRADGPPAKPAAPAAARELPGPFRCYLVVGKARHTDKFHCPVSEHGLNPVALVLVRGTDPSPEVLDLLKALDAAVEKHRNARLASSAVFLSDLADLVKEDDKRDEIVAQLRPKVANLKNLAVGLDTVEALKKARYELDDQAEVTVILYHRLKVLGTLTFAKGALNKEGIQKVVDAVQAALEGIRKGQAAPAAAPG